VTLPDISPVTDLDWSQTGQWW